MCSGIVGAPQYIGVVGGFLPPTTCTRGNIFTPPAVRSIAYIKGMLCQRIGIPVKVVLKSTCDRNYVQTEVIWYGSVCNAAIHPYRTL